MSLKIGLLSDGDIPVIDTAYTSSMFKLLGSLDVSLRTTGLTEIESIAIQSYIDLINNGITHPKAVDIYCPWVTKSKRIFPWFKQYHNMNLDVFNQTAVVVRNCVSPSWDRCNMRHRQFQANSVLILLGSKLNEPLDVLLVQSSGSKTSQLSLDVTIRMAGYLKIPVVNIIDDQGIQELTNVLGSKLPLTLDRNPLLI